MMLRSCLLLRTTPHGKPQGSAAPTGTGAASGSAAKTVLSGVLEDVRRRDQVTPQLENLRVCVSAG